MKLAKGTRLGPYEIKDPVGAGGMGVVYRADDTRLGRQVAIKVLPHADEERLRRFEREARVTGNLSHPNLLTLYDIGVHDGTPFIVTELLEGETLGDRMKRGRLRLREAMKIGADIARGLAAAHAAGIVHRDIKPANIFLTSDSRTKILDFGIAKLVASDERPARIPQTSPGLASAATATDVMIGTPGYMAPEQIEGDTVDARTDIFTFGLLLYEMVSGVRAFAAASPIEEAYAILKQAPEAPTGAPKTVARIVLRCLEKRPDDRFQSANDLAFALDELDAATDPVPRISANDLAEPGTPASKAVADEADRKLVIRILAALALVAVAGLGLLIGRTTARGNAASTAERWPSFVEAGPLYRRVTYHSQTRWNARLAKDGQSAIYSRSLEGREQVMRSSLAEPSIVPLHIDGRLLDLSSRGEFAVVIEPVSGDGGTLMRVVEGTGPRPVTDHVTDAAWLKDGATLAVLRDGTALELPVGTRILERKAGWLDHIRASPSGNHVAIVEHPARAETGGKVIIVDHTGKQVAASPEHLGIEGAAWSPDGSELWFSDASTIYGIDLHGTQRTVLHGAPGRLALIDVVGTSILVAPTDLRLQMFTGPRGGPYHEVSWFDSSDVEGISIDGATVAFIEDSGTGRNADGYALFVRRGDQPPSKFAHGYRFALVPDGSAAIVVGGAAKLTRVPTGVGTSAPIALGPIAQLDTGDPIAIAWQGRHAVVRGADGSGAMKLWRMDLSATPAAPTPIEVAHDGGRHPISPDGSQIAIAREAGGVQIVAVSGGTPESIEGSVGEEPLSFSSDGASLFVSHVAGDTIEVDRISLSTRTRESWLRIVPEQRPVYYSLALDGTGQQITYSSNSDASDLFVLTPPARR
jgi:eukaryotic-like serine/threonine-protein kinase